MYSREQNSTTHSARHGAANTPEHSNGTYLPNSSLSLHPIGDRHRREFSELYIWTAYRDCYFYNGHAPDD